VWSPRSAHDLWRLGFDGRHDLSCQIAAETSYVGPLERRHGVASPAPPPTPTSTLSLDRHSLRPGWLRYFGMSAEETERSIGEARYRFPVLYRHPHRRGSILLRTGA
jgi:hypothetical protein